MNRHRYCRRQNLTSSHDNLFSQHFLTFYVLLYLCLYRFFVVGAVGCCARYLFCVMELLLLVRFFPLSLCSHRDLLIMVFCCSQINVCAESVNKKPQKEKNKSRKSEQISSEYERNKNNFCQIFLKNRNVFISLLLIIISSFI